MNKVHTKSLNEAFPQIGALLASGPDALRPDAAKTTPEDLARGVGSTLWAPVAASIADALKGQVAAGRLQAFTQVVADLEQFERGIADSSLSPADKRHVRGFALALLGHYRSQKQDAEARVQADVVATIQEAR